METYCCRCGENFPVAKEPTRWQMGMMRELKLAPKKVRKEWKECACSNELGKKYLCGNCYFDMTD